MHQAVSLCAVVREFHCVWQCHCHPRPAVMTTERLLVRRSRKQLRHFWRSRQEQLCTYCVRGASLEAIILLALTLGSSNSFKPIAMS